MKKSPEAKRLAALERELVERLGLVPSRRASRRRFRRCVYCGTHSYGRTCPSHRDLVQLEA